MAPGGALYSTASDMIKFLSANMGLIKEVLLDELLGNSLNTFPFFNFI